MSAVARFYILKKRRQVEIWKNLQNIERVKVRNCLSELIVKLGSGN